MKERDKKKFQRVKKYLSKGVPVIVHQYWKLPTYCKIPAWTGSVEQIKSQYHSLNNTDCYKITKTEHNIS